MPAKKQVRRADSKIAAATVDRVKGFEVEISEAVDLRTCVLTYKGRECLWVVGRDCCADGDAPWREQDDARDEQESPSGGPWCTGGRHWAPLDRCGDRRYWA